MIRRAVLVALALAAPALAHAQACQCIDVGDIKARMLEAQTAINAYGQEMQKMAEQMQRTQQPIPYTKERREKLQGRVQVALNGVAKGRISTTPTMGDNPGGTDNLCNVTIGLHPSATACMRESVRRHEEYHRQECLKTRTAGKIGTSVRTGQDRFERDGIQLTQYASEEIGGYQAELAFLSAEQARLAKACQPPKREVRDYTAERRNRNPVEQATKDPVQEGVSQARRLLGF